MYYLSALIATAFTFIDDRFQDRKDRGATAVEYGLIIGLIAVAIIGAVFALGGELTTIFGNVSDKLVTPSGVGGES